MKIFGIIAIIVGIILIILIILREKIIILQGMEEGKGIYPVKIRRQKIIGAGIFAIFFGIIYLLFS